MSGSTVENDKAVAQVPLYMFTVAVVHLVLHRYDDEGEADEDEDESRSEDDN